MADFGPFEPSPKIAVAVSGGIDSMALAELLQHWVAALNGHLTILTVDHNLRVSSAAEAQSTAEYWRHRGVGAEILTVAAAAPVSRIEETARYHRWQLLEGWCRQHGVLHLFLAHHANDQAETVLMRLGKSSGVDGLAGMRGVSYRPAIRVLRPLLGLTRARLLATCKAEDLPIIHDPSNQDPRFLRTRLRAMAPVLGDLGLTPERLTSFAGEQAELADTANQVLARDGIHCGAIDALGCGVLTWQHYAALPIKRRAVLLARMIDTIGGRTYPIGSDGIGRLTKWLTQNYGSMRGITLGGCRIQPVSQQRQPAIAVTREVAAIAETPLVVSAGGTLVWDGRFAITVAGAAAICASHGSYSIGPADNAVWRKLKSNLPNALVDLQARIRWTLPAVLQGNQPVGVLAPGFIADQPDLQGWQATFLPARAWLRTA